MIIRLDHYRRSSSRATVESYYSPQRFEHAATGRASAKILYTPWRRAPHQLDNGKGINRTQAPIDVLVAATEV